jgi:hypothetical protein
MIYKETAETPFVNYERHPRQYSTESIQQIAGFNSLNRKVRIVEYSL